ncbi:hypothetical protein AB0C87_22790 [Actinomadura sp. NPDC048021]|uniref:hypothetical protein n=1 Tax=Actinomadura sp. NPDC048021 TaxID=3155385 RepID=UPI0034072266
MSDSNDRGRVISGNTGPLNLGEGDINANTVVIKGDGVKVVNGDNKGGISRSFGGKKKR